MCPFTTHTETSCKLLRTKPAENMSCRRTLRINAQSTQQQINDHFNRNPDQVANLSTITRASTGQEKSNLVKGLSKCNTSIYTERAARV